MSENFIVSARKYRPQTWESVVGQQSITGTLQNAINNGQIAQAYLFCGPRGVGKTTCARIFAREINKAAAEQDADLSFNVFELDAASNNSVDEMRSLTDQVRIPPQIGKYKVYIVDEVHMLSQSAFNAFLKTLEEPPAHAVFILATTEKHKILPTILSRCQIFDFNRIQVDDMVKHLQHIAEQEGVTASEEALHIIAQKADGALRDALSIFDQVVAFCGKDLKYESVIENLNVLDYEYYFEMTECFLNEDISKTLLTLDGIINKGFDPHHFITGLGEHLRNLMVSKDPETVDLLEVSASVRDRYVEQGASIDIRVLVQALDFINQCDVQYRTSTNQRLLAEFTLIQICSIPYNMEEKKKGKFCLKPFEGSIPPGIKKPIRSVSVQEEKPEVRVPVTRKEVLTAEKPLMAGSGPKRKYNFSSPLISGLITNHQDGDVQVETVEEVEVDHGSETFSREEFEAAWKGYAERFLKNDKHSTYYTLTAKMPALKGEEIVLEIHNRIQENEVKNIRGEMLAYVKNTLKNSNLTLQVIRVEDESKSPEFYTDRDKYDKLKEKNPSLEYFRKKFNLDIEF